jgi:hypothetical protein
MSYNILKYNNLSLVIILFVLCFPAAARCSAPGENYRLHLENGLEVQLYTPQEVLEMTYKDASGRLIFELSGGTSYQFIDDIGDSQIMSKGDGSFHPMNVDWVIDALGNIDIPGASLNMRVTVYVLPFPRSGFLASSTCGSDVFLSPGVYEVNRYSMAFTVAHEVGHVFQQRYAPVSNAGAWPEYLTLRGIYHDPLYVNDSPRMNRPIEIFAEDFRYLFGGAEARYSGTIENPNISMPDRVSGLMEFFVSLVATEEIVTTEPERPRALSLSNYPNPFNPSTTIRVAFDDPASVAGREIDLSIYRIDGSLVRNLYHGRIMEDEYSIRWDGKDAGGHEAASGLYLYSVRSGSRSATGKMLLMR